VAKGVIAKGMALLPAISPLFGPFAPIAAGILSIVAVIFSAAHLISIATNDPSIDDVKLAVHDLALDTMMHTRGISVLTENLQGLYATVNDFHLDALESRTQQATFIFEREIDRVTSGIETLHLHRLSPKLVKSCEVREALAILESKLKPEGLRLVSDKVDSVFRAETSFLFFNNGTLRILVHLPCYRDGGILTLLKHVSIPMAFENNKTIRFTPKHQFLAVDGSGNLFKTLDNDAFHQCQRLEELWTCPNINQYDKRTGDSCLVSLYKSDSSATHRNCKVKLETAEDFISQLNSTTFVLYLASLQQIERICPKLKSRGESSTVTTQGLVKIQLQPGCKVITPSFVFEADENVFGDPREVTFRMADLKQILDPLTEEMASLSPHDLDLISSKEGLELPKSVQMIKVSSSTSKHRFWVLVISLTGFLLISSTITCLIFFKCKKNCLSSPRRNEWFLYQRCRNNTPRANPDSHSGEMASLRPSEI
jgi:hypothetical protein